MISIIVAILTAMLVVALLILVPWWLTATLLIVGGTALLVLGLCRVSSKPYPIDKDDDDNVYEFKRGAP